MPLSDLKVRKLKPKNKPYKLADAEGLYIYVPKSGKKVWRMNYILGGKQKTLTIGQYPVISLKKARRRRDDARELLSKGIDPSEKKQQAKQVEIEITVNTFENIAREWHAKNCHLWVEKRQKTTLSNLERNVFPTIGKMPIKDIKAPDLLIIIDKLEARGIKYTAHKTMQHCGRVFRYAIATARADHDISADIKGAIAPHRQKHFPSITVPKEVGKLLQAIDSFEGYFVVGCALKVSPLVFVRPGELRHAEWSEIDFDDALWRIPAEKMKMRTDHKVPLAKQTLAILKEIKPITGETKYVFPSVRTNSRPISENTVNVALRRMGYTKDEMTAHGFRSMASTLLYEQGFNSDYIELQLAHRERNSSKAAYNRAEHLEKRRDMMQRWADYLDKLKQQ